MVAVKLSALENDERINSKKGYSSDF